MKTILVPLGGGDADATVLETALAVARPLAAHLELVHVRVTAAEAALHTPHIEFARGAGLASALDSMARRAEHRCAEAERHGRALCAEHNIALVEGPSPGAAEDGPVTARWRCEDGEPIARLLFHARHNDLTVMARPTTLDGLPADRLEALLLKSGRSLLIAPAGAPMRALDTVLVCWKETRDAARAVSAAMPILRKARRVIVVSVSEHGERPGEAVAELVGQLAWHGIAAASEVMDRLGRPTAEVLSAAAGAHAADLMVMGAYGRGRLREALFGGCTQRALEGADCGVLLVCTEPGG